MKFILPLNNLTNNILQTLGPIPIYLLLFVVIYFLMIRPSIQQQKKHANMLSNLKKGDSVVTKGGLMGKIFEINKENVLLDVGNNAKLRVLKSHISNIDNQ
ncbi:MAG: preprotein translocase subunit YajC [Candidatus Marinimicrobia bacterium]|nr:preprotein translocase subunit YajC [Candidatus Neomarinimicrobiota bacterium]|tara:strand:- start:3316 stop:3618 length:303 start_codon:yes stop_codon:yes gene_type:complete